MHNQTLHWLEGFIQAVGNKPPTQEQWETLVKYIKTEVEINTSPVYSKSPWNVLIGETKPKVTPQVAPQWHGTRAVGDWLNDVNIPIPTPERRKHLEQTISSALSAACNR